MAKLGMADEEEKECLVQLLGERRRRNVLSRDGEKKRGKSPNLSLEKYEKYHEEDFASFKFF